MTHNESLQLNTEERLLLKAIESGKYRDYYLIYNRKSTDEPENQKNSIKYQKSENARFAYREHLNIAPITMESFCLDGVISEKHSGFKEGHELLFGKSGTIQYYVDRPKFYQLVQYLSKGYFKGVIFLSWDRASRNKGDNTIINKLLMQGVDFRFTLASYDKTSAGALHMDIDSMFAEHNSRVTSEKVSLTIKNKREQGICTYRAPVGYLNLGQMEHKPHDPVRAHIIKKMFEFYATGNWNLSDLVQWSINQGFTMALSRKPRTKAELMAEEDEDMISKNIPISRPPTTKSIHSILSNRFYIGEIKGNNGVYVKSNSHTALVSIDLFNTVQLIKGRKNISVHYSNRLPFPMRGLLRCGNCNRLYTPYFKKGFTYLGCHCKQDCTNRQKNINIKYITDKIGKELKGLSFTDAELEEITAKAWTDVDVAAIKQKDEDVALERQKAKIKGDLTYLVTNKLLLLKTGAYTPESLVEEETKLQDGMKTLELKVNQGAHIKENFEIIVKLSELLKSLYLYYEKVDYYEKQKIIKAMFSELTFLENTLQYKCKLGFGIPRRSFMAVCESNTILSEVGTLSDILKESLESVETLVDDH